MKINLVFPNLYTPLSFSPAVQILAAVLKRTGHKVSFTHIHKDMVPNDEKHIIEDIKKNNPDLIGFTSTSFEYARCNEIAGAIKREITTPVILGGIHATISPEDYDSSNFDAFVVGEGDDVIVSIANGEIKPEGIIYGKPMKNLDTLPFFDWDIMNSEEIIASKDGWINIGFSRGCPFNCTFCADPLLRKMKGITTIRKRNVENCINELKYIVSRFDVKVINFDDDVFTVNRKWLYHFLTEYKKEIYDKHGIQFVIESRVDTFSEEMAKKLKESGCREIQFGVETGSKRLRNFIKKGVTDEQIIKAFDICRKYGINTYTYMMIGIPTETEEDLKSTMKLLSVIKPNLIRPTFLCPVKGTEMYDYCVEHDLIKKDVTVWNYESPLELDTVSTHTLFKYWFMFPWMINYNMEYEEYKEEIDRFSNLDYDTLTGMETFNRLLDKDAELSKMMKARGLEHYVHKAEKGKNESRTFRFNRIELVKPQNSNIQTS